MFFIPIFLLFPGNQTGISVIRSDESVSFLDFLIYYVIADVINRLNLLRGKGMANLYSWSSKR